MPHRWGAVTAIAAFVAIAASTAFPPEWRTAIPAWVANWSAEQTIAPGARTEEDGVIGIASNVGDARRAEPERIDYNGLVHRHHAPPLALSIGASVVLVGTFLPWWRSGARRRSSYALLDLVDRLELASNDWATNAIRFWPIVPVLVVGAVVATWWGWRHVGIACALFAGGYALTLAVIVRRAPGTALVGTGVTIIGAVMLLLAAFLVALRTPA